MTLQYRASLGNALLYCPGTGKLLSECPELTEFPDQFTVVFTPLQPLILDSPQILPLFLGLPSPEYRLVLDDPPPLRFRLLHRQGYGVSVEVWFTTTQGADFWHNTPDDHNDPAEWLGLYPHPWPVNHVTAYIDENEPVRVTL